MAEDNRDLIFRAGRGTSNRMRLQCFGREVRFILDCVDEYEASVVFQDMHERLLAGEEIVIGQFYAKREG